MYLLNNGIADNRFLKPVTDYGLDLVETAFTSKQVAKSSSQMSYDVLVKEAKVVKAAYDLTCWYAMDSRTIKLAQEMMCKVHTRGDVCDVLSWQLACGSVDCSMTDLFRDGTYYSGLGALEDERTAGFFKNAFVYQPMKNCLTLGLYNKIYGN